MGGDSAVPGWAGVGQAKAWNARATRLARRLESRGVSAEQLFVLLDVVLPTGWDSEAGITLSDEESGWHLRELVSIGSAAAASLRMRRVTQANASVPRCKNRCHRAANVPYDTCCQACSRPRHTHQWRDNDFLEARRAALAWEEPGQPPPCAIRAMHPRGQPLAYAIRTTHPQGLPSRTDPLQANSRRRLCRPPVFWSQWP